MTELPAPLTTPDCDLRDFQFMPLLIARLRRSKAWLKCKRRPELAFYMINLWTAAWHETPAASLEDDDDVLADLAMCDPAKWQKMRADVLHGWVKCSDGRLYHRVIAEQATEAWRHRTGYRERLSKAREAREAKRNGRSTGTVTGSMIETITEPITGGVTDDITATVTEQRIEQSTVLKGQGQGQGQVQEPPVVPHADPPPWGHRTWLASWHPHASAWTDDPQRPGLGLRPIVGGWFADVIWERVIDAGHLPQNRYDTPDKLAPVAEWLCDGIEPDQIVAAIQRVAGRPGYSPPDSLRYFDRVVRDRERVPA
jgi:hypothetical protein